MKRFDASLKHLLETYPRDWLTYLAAPLGLPVSGPVVVIDSELSTVSAAADKVLRVGGRTPWLFHLEMQASHNHHLGQQILLYNVLLSDRHNLPVRSVVLLLRPEADRGSLTGVVRQALPDDDWYLEFHYTVVRLWQQPVESLLTSGLGLLPLAPLADVPASRLEPVIDRIHARVKAEASPAEGANLWTATYVLLGLQYSAAFASLLLRRAMAMEESATYQAIVAQGMAQGMAQGVVQGKIEALQEVLLDLGSLRFDPPDKATRRALQQITDLEHLKKLSESLLTVSSWHELLQVPPPRRRSGGRKKRSP